MTCAALTRWLFVALAWAAASAATAQTPPGWLRLPSAREAARYYPADARLAGIEGAATIRCAIQGRGRTASLANCAVMAETPAGHGFGEAALRMAPLFRLRWSRGQGAGGVIEVPIRFKRPPAGPVKTPRAVELRPAA